MLLNRQGQDMLKDSKQLWLWAEENLPQKHQDRFAQLKLLDLNTSRAWAMKENLRRLWEQPTLTAAGATIWCIGSSGCGVRAQADAAGGQDAVRPDAQGAELPLHRSAPMPARGST